MLSKRLRLTNVLSFFATLSVLTLLGCSYFFDEKVKVTEVEYNDHSSSCLNSVNTTVAHFFDVQKEVRSQDLQAAADCYHATLESFITHTKSGRSDSEDYSADNIVMLIHKLHPDFKITVSEVESYLSIKRVLLGGAEKTISKTEIQIVQDLIAELGEGLIALLPHRKILLGKENLPRTDEGYANFGRAIVELKDQLNHFLVRVDRHKSKRTIDLKVLGKFLISYLENSEQYEPHLNLMVRFKQLTLNNSEESLQREDLAIFVRQITLTYQALLTYQYFIKDDRIFTNIGNIVTFFTKVPQQVQDSEMFQTISLQAIRDVMDLAELILSYSARSKPGHVIPVTRITDVISALEQTGIMNGGLTSGTLNYFIEKFSARWLLPSTRAPDISADKISYIKTIFLTWYERQMLLNKLFLEPERRQDVSFLSVNRLSRLSPKIERWSKIFEKVSLFQWDKSRKIVLMSRDLNQISYGELTASNSIQTLLQLFLKPFNMQTENIEEFKLTAQQTQETYEVMRILGVELAFMDSRIYDSGLRTFKEANNFTTQIRNDDYFDFYEAYEYLSAAISAGQLAEQVYKKIPESCLLDYRDVHHSLVIRADCYRSVLKQNFSTLFHHFRAINRFWENANNQDRDQFLVTLEYASRSGVITQKAYDLGEIRSMTTILYYLESIFFVFDENRNALAEGNEVINAEVHFRSFIRNFILVDNVELIERVRPYLFSFCGDAESNEEIAECLAPKIFVHLLRTGNLPMGLSYSAIRLLTTNAQNAMRTLSASPKDVLGVFSALSQLNSKAQIEQVKSFLLKHHESLFAALDQDVAPECRLRSENYFCLWARLIFCNETINADLYKWMKENKYSLFPAAPWRDDPERAVLQTMDIINFTFLNHQRFSTQCSFPKLDDQKTFETSEMPEEGAREPAPTSQSGGGFMDSIQNLKDYFNRF